MPVTASRRRLNPAILARYNSQQANSSQQVVTFVLFSYLYNYKFFFEKNFDMKHCYLYFDKFLSIPIKVDFATF